MKWKRREIVKGGGEKKQQQKKKKKNNNNNNNNFEGPIVRISWKFMVMWVMWPIALVQPYVLARFIVARDANCVKFGTKIISQVSAKYKLKLTHHAWDASKRGDHFLDTLYKIVLKSMLCISTIHTVAYFSQLPAFHIFISWLYWMTWNFILSFGLNFAQLDGVYYYY